MNMPVDMDFLFIDEGLLGNLFAVKATKNSRWVTSNNKKFSRNKFIRGKLLRYTTALLRLQRHRHHWASFTYSAWCEMGVGVHLHLYKSDFCTEFSLPAMYAYYKRNFRFVKVAPWGAVEKGYYTQDQIEARKQWAEHVLFCKGK